MSRIGFAPIEIPAGVEVSIADNTVSVKGKLGELTQSFPEDQLSIKVEENVLSVERKNEEKDTKAQHGLHRSLFNNMIEGVSNGYTLELELVGVGYRANAQGQILELSLGFSHDVVFQLPSEIKIETVSERGQNPLIKLQSHDKQLVGMVAAKIRSLRKPEPYKGKGIRFKGEQIRRKAGKSAAK